MVQASRAATIPAEGLPNRTLAAAAAVLGYATLIGYTDNYVRVVAAEGGLWQFHLIRSLMAGAVFFLVAPLLGLELRPKNWRAVAGGRRCMAARCLSISDAWLFCRWRRSRRGCSRRRSSCF
jgi:hypothetical protein